MAVLSTTSYESIYRQRIRVLVTGKDDGLGYDVPFWANLSHPARG
jgi:hypothetical protein